MRWLWLFLFVSLGANADWVTSAGGDALLIGTRRWIHATDALTEQSAPTDGIFIGGADLSLSRERWAFELRPELRALWSPSVGSATTAADHLSFQGPRRWADLDWHINHDERTDVHLDWERLAVSYRSSEYEALVGRKIFSGGVLKLFPVWNKFSRPLPFLPSPLLLYGQDQILVSGQKDKLSARAAFLAEDERRDNTYWFEVGYLPESFELRLLAAYWWQQRVYGMAAATDFRGATLRAESLLVSPGEKDNPESQTQLSFGAERLFAEKWTWLYEFYYQDIGVDSVDDYRLATPSRFSPLRAKHYSAAQLVYQFKETLTFAASALANHLDGSLFALFKIDDSLDENSNLIFELKGPLQASRGEFSERALRFPGDNSLGAPSQLSLSYKRFF